MGKLIPICRATPTWAEEPTLERSWLLEQELRPPLVLLFLASMARVAFALAHQRDFDAEGDARARLRHRAALAGLAIRSEPRLRRERRLAQSRVSPPPSGR